MEADTVVEPAREHLMPRMREVRAAAKQAGALALVISGAGPTLCAVCDNEVTAALVAQTMQAIYEEAGIGGVSRHTQVTEEGAQVITT
jgi:homoserine kinase